MVRRVVRLVVWVVGSASALAVFVAVRRWSSVPVRWSDVSGWLSDVDRDEAVVELVRWVGVVVAGYVFVVAVLALLAELAAATRLVSLSRLLSRVGSWSAVPVLRARLWRAATTVAASASSVAMVSGGLATAASPVPVELTVDTVPVGSPVDASLVLPAGLGGGSFSGFGLDTAAPIPPTPGLPVGESVRVVVRGDTVWELADEVYGFVDAGVIGHVADANGLADPALIFEGQTLVFPPLASPVDVVLGSGGATWATHRVVSGDTLWDILDRHYGFADADLVWRVAGVNGLENPSEIPVGAVLTLPSLEDTAPPPDLVVERPTVETLPIPASTLPSPRDVVDVVASPPTGPSTIVPSSTVPSSVVPSSVPSSVVPSSVASSVPSVSVAGVGDDLGDVADDDVVELFDVSVRTLWWQVPMGLLLAAGLVAMMRRLRGRRAAGTRAGEQLLVPPPVASGTELAALAAAPAGRVATLQALLRAVTPHAREHDDPPPVRAVELGDDRLEVLFTEPAPFPPAGWSTVDGGISWVHRLSGEVSAPVRQLVTPALVTLGRRDSGGEVLLDVETAGSLALVGDRAAVLGVARSMTLELATYPLGVPMDVCLVGFEMDGVENCDRTWSNTTLTRAVRVARETLERTAATGAVSLLAARAATDDDTGMLDPQVFVVDVAAVADAERVLLDELVELCQPHSGAATILIGGHRAACEQMELESSTVAVWSGARLRPPVIDREAVAQVAVMFDHVVNADEVPLRLSEVIADAFAGDVSMSVDRGDDEMWSAGEVAAGSDVVEFVYEPPVFDVLVQCLGEVTVLGRDVTQAGEVELLTLLTCMRAERPNIDTIYTMLVPDSFGSRSTGAPVEPLRPMQQRVSRLRVKLGADAEGNDLLPAAKPGRGSPSRYAVSARVLTDFELLEHRYHTSMELSSVAAFDLLRDGLVLFRGPVLRARKGYSWACTEAIASKICNIVIAYAVRLIDLAFERDDIATVLETVRRCCLVIDDPLVELPIGRRVSELAEFSGHPELVAAVVEARSRLATYVDDNDPLAEADI